MSIYESVKIEKCPKCGEKIYSEGVNLGIGYIYPPLHCYCGWSEMCEFEDENDCKKCDQYENCYRS